jgi:membrane protein required for colicin V production
MPIQWLDVILIVIMLISAFLAMLRGLTREMLSIMSWAAAALAALFCYQMYKDKVRTLIEPPILADAVLIAVVFLITLLLVSLVTMRISDRVLDSRVGAVDRTFGFLFGLVRGLILVVIAYELIVAIVPRESLPTWVTQARSLPVIESTGKAIISVLPENPASIFRGDRPGTTGTPGTSGSITPRERQAVLRAGDGVYSYAHIGHERRDHSNG